MFKLDRIINPNLMKNKDIEEKASNCCNGEIDIVDNQNYGICTKCFTRIGYHDKKDNDKYDPHYIGFSKGFEEGYEKAKIIEVEEYKKNLLKKLDLYFDGWLKQEYREEITKLINSKT